MYCERANQIEKTMSFLKALLNFITSGKDIGDLNNCANFSKIKYFDNRNEYLISFSPYNYCMNNQDTKKDNLFQVKIMLMKC